MSFRILSGDIAMDYTHHDHVLSAPNRPPILLDKSTVSAFTLLKQENKYDCSTSRGLLILVICLVFFGFTWPTFVLAIVGSLKASTLYTFQITIRYYGTFIATADKKSYQQLLTAISTAA